MYYPIQKVKMKRKNILFLIIAMKRKFEHKYIYKIRQIQRKDLEFILISYHFSD